MDAAGFLLTFTMFWKLSSSLVCYSCEPCPVLFDDSAQNKYLKDCTHSTMCYKRVSSLDFGNGLTSQIVERGCAAQTQDGEQKKVGRKWVEVNQIYEVYEEGCVRDVTYPERRTDTLICYCRGDRCNAAARFKYGSFIEIFMISSLILWLVSIRTLTV